MKSVLKLAEFSNVLILLGYSPVSTSYHQSYPQVM